jgi:DNA-binding NarL/FixJ family response regulator
VDASTIRVLIAVREDSAARFRENLATEGQMKLTVTTSAEEAKTALASGGRQFDAFVVDNGLGSVFELIKELRQQYPRLWVVLVDEDADFAMPGRADAATTEPFKNDDLVRKIKKLAEERRLETLHADTLAPVKAFARQLAKAGKDAPKPQAAVDTARQLGYDYVAYYSVVATTPPSLTLIAQAGPDNVKSLVPAKSDYSGIVGWVAQNGQSRLITPGDELSHPLLNAGTFQMAACTPVGNTLRFGVLFACKQEAGAITQENVLMLELISGQLAAALAKETRN